MRTRSVTAAVALALALAACAGGGDSGEPSASASRGPAPTAGELTLVGTASLQWQSPPSSAEVTGGELDTTIECDGAVPHNLVVEGVDDEDTIAECSGDDRGTGTVELEPGTYTFYCSIPGHRSAGMETEITIQSSNPP